MTKKHRILLALCLLLLGCSSLGRFTTYSLSTYEKESSSSKRDVEEYLVQENPVDSLNIRISGNEYFLLAGINQAQLFASSNLNCFKVNSPSMKAAT